LQLTIRAVVRPNGSAPATAQAARK